MKDEDRFHDGLDEDPTNWHARTVFADWLQDNNDPRAEGYRALGMMRVFPFNNTKNISTAKCGYCGDEAEFLVEWFKGPPGKPGPVRVRWCGTCSLADALAKRGMTAPVEEGKDYSLKTIITETMVDLLLPYYVGLPWYWVKTSSYEKLLDSRLPWQWWDVLKVHEPDAANAKNELGGAANGVTGAAFSGTSSALPFKTRREAEDAAARAFMSAPTYFRRLWLRGYRDQIEGERQTPPDVLTGAPPF